MKPVKSAFVALLALTALAGGANADQIVITFGGDPYPPFESKNAAGEWQGFEVEVAHAICERAGLDCTVTDIPWEGIIPAVSSGKVDAAFASLGITEERRKVVGFSLPYYADPVALAGPEGSDLDLSPESLAGKTIGLLGGTTHFAYAEKHYGASMIKVYQTPDEVVADLAAGRIDAAMGDQTPLMAFLATDAGKGLEIKGLYPRDPAVWGEGKAAVLNKQATGLKERFDAAIRKIYADGTYQAIMGRYFKHDISTPPSN